MPYTDSDFWSDVYKGMSWLPGLGFQVVAKHSETSFGQVTYANRTTFVRPTLERRDQLVYFEVGKLQDGAVPPVAVWGPSRGEPLRQFHVWALLWLKTGDRAMAAALGHYDSEEPELIRKAIRQNAEELRCYGMKILHGDFSEFPEIRKLMISRLRPNTGETDDQSVVKEQ